MKLDPDRVKAHATRLIRAHQGRANLLGPTENAIIVALCEEINKVLGLSDEKPFGCSSDCRAPDCGGGCSQ